MHFSSYCYALLLAFSCSATAEIYKWEDEDGKIHYSDKPLGKDAESVKLKSAPKADPDQGSRQEKQRRLLKLLEDDREAAKKKKAQEKAEKAERKEKCLTARKELEQVRNASFLYKKSDDPLNPLVYSEKERQEITRGLQEDIKKWCSD